MCQVQLGHGFYKSPESNASENWHQFTTTARAGLPLPAHGVPQ